MQWSRGQKLGIKVYNIIIVSYKPWGGGGEGGEVIEGNKLSVCVYCSVSVKLPSLRA